MPQLTNESERLTLEKKFHDKQALCIEITPGKGGWSDCESPTWPNEPKIAPGMIARMLAVLGDVSGKRVLVYGCGFDPSPTWFARRGAHVTAIDISPESINDQKILRDGYGVSIDLRVMDAFDAAFPDQSFDIIYGNAFLNHVDSEKAAREISRLLTPGGVALFKEVQPGNAFARLYRKLTPRWRTPSQHALTGKDYDIYRRYFRTVNVSTHVLTAMPYVFVHRMIAIMIDVMHIRYWPPESKSLLRLCESMDRALEKIPGVRSQMWLSLVELRL